MQTCEALSLVRSEQPSCPFPSHSPTGTPLAEGLCIAVSLPRSFQFSRQSLFFYEQFVSPSNEVLNRKGNGRVRRLQCPKDKRFTACLLVQVKVLVQRVHFFVEAKGDRMICLSEASPRGLHATLRSPPHDRAHNQSANREACASLESGEIGAVGSRPWQDICRRTISRTHRHTLPERTRRVARARCERSKRADDSC